MFACIEYLVSLNLVPDTLLPMCTGESKYYNLDTKVLGMFDPDKNFIQEFVDHILGYTFAPFMVRDTYSNGITISYLPRYITTRCFDTFRVPQSKHRDTMVTKNLSDQVFWLNYEYFPRRRRANAYSGTPSRVSGSLPVGIALLRGFKAWFGLSTNFTCFNLRTIVSKECDQWFIQSAGLHGDPTKFITWRNEMSTGCFL